MKKAIWTAIGTFNDNGQVYVTHVEATNPRGAFRKAQTEIDGNAACGGRILSIIPGEHMDVCPDVANAA